MVDQTDFSKIPSELYVTSRQQDAGLTRWQLTPEDIIEELENDLKGKTWNSKEEKFVGSAEAEALINEKGIRSIISIVRSKINKITFLSNLDQKDIISITRDVNLTMISLLFSNANNFEIKKENLEIITDQVVHLVYMGLMRALNEGERRFLGKAEKRMEVFKNESSGQSQGINILRR